MREPMARRKEMQGKKVKTSRRKTQKRVREY
jgi:hypothetical protein